MRITISIFFVALLLLLVGACKSVRISELSTEDVNHVSKKDLLSHISSFKVSNYESVEIKKFSASYTNGNENNRFKGFLRYAPQQQLMVSVSPAIGIEMFRLLAREDSLGYIDRYNKEFYFGNYDFLRRRMNIDLNFNLLQFLISGDIQTLPTVFRPSRRFDFEHRNSQVVLSNVVTVEGSEVVLEFVYGGDLSLREFNINRLTDGDFVSVQYLDYFTESGKRFPKTMVLKANKGVGVTSFKVEYKSIVFNKALNFPFSISSKYKEIIAL